MKDKIISDLHSVRHSVRSLAKEMDCSYEHLTLVLNGKRPMTYKVAKKLVNALNNLTDSSYNMIDFGF